MTEAFRVNPNREIQAWISQVAPDLITPELVSAYQEFAESSPQSDIQLEIPAGPGYGQFTERQMPEHLAQKTPIGIECASRIFYGTYKDLGPENQIAARINPQLLVQRAILEYIAATERNRQTPSAP